MKKRRKIFVIALLACCFLIYITSQELQKKKKKAIITSQNQIIHYLDQELKVQKSIYLNYQFDVPCRFIYESDDGNIIYTWIIDFKYVDIIQILEKKRLQFKCLNFEEDKFPCISKSYFPKEEGYETNRHDSVLLRSGSFDLITINDNNRLTNLEGLFKNLNGLCKKQ